MHLPIKVQNCNISPCTEIKSYNLFYFETSNGKSMSDELGSVAKSYVSREVAANKLIIRYGWDMYEFCVANFTIVEGKGKMLSHHFIWFKEEDLEAVREILLVMVTVK